MKRKIIDSFRHEYEFLSNFYEHWFYWEGLLWPTSENAYQASKATNKVDREKVRTTGTPGWAKRIGRQIKMRADWEQVKDKAMYAIVKAKFSDPVMRKKLLATGNAILIEGNNWGDKYWGQVNGSGENKLGKILMRVRKKLVTENDAAAELVGIIKKDLRKRLPAIRKRRGKVLLFQGDRKILGAVYVGRIKQLQNALPCPNKQDWGNPYMLREIIDEGDAERQLVVKKHFRWMARRLATDIALGKCELLKHLADLAGKDLVCHCAPKPCHAVAISMLAGWSQIHISRMRKAKRPLHTLVDVLMRSA